MVTRAEIRTRIESSTWRQVNSDDMDLTTVDEYIQSAIDEIVLNRKWKWRQTFLDFNTSAATYALPAAHGSTRTLIYYTGNDPFPLFKETYERIIRMWDTVETGDPINYAEHNDLIYFGPALSKAYDFKLVYNRDFTLTSDGDSNYVTDNLTRPLIAKINEYLGAGILHDDLLVARSESLYAKLIMPFETEDDEQDLDHLNGEVQPDSYLHERAFNGASWNEVN